MFPPSKMKRELNRNETEKIKTPSSTPLHEEGLLDGLTLCLTPWLREH